MSNVHDVAAYILEVYGTLSAMKLQKLVYYSQAWSLVWDDRLMFSERIEAWANGPVAPDLYNLHRGEFQLSEWPWGHSGQVDEIARDTVDLVLGYYGPMNAQQLSDLTHAEAPWREARKGLKAGERGTRVITPAAMMEYYSSLTDEDAEG